MQYVLVKRQKLEKFNLKKMHCCLPSGTNKIGELMNCLEKRRKLTRNVPLARIVPSQS